MQLTMPFKFSLEKSEYWLSYPLSQRVSAGELLRGHTHAAAGGVADGYRSASASRLRLQVARHALCQHVHKEFHTLQMHKP